MPVMTINKAVQLFKKHCPNEVPIAYWKDSSGYILEVKLPNPKVYRSPLYRVNFDGLVFGTRPDLENIVYDDRQLI